MVCRTVRNLAANNDPDPDANSRAAQDALRSPTPSIRTAGALLQAAADSTMNGGLDLPSITKAHTTFIVTCNALFGDGVW